MTSSSTRVLAGSRWAVVTLTGATAGAAADAVADGQPGVWSFKNDQGQVLARNSQLPPESGPLELVDITDHHHTENVGPDDDDDGSDDSE